MLKKLFGGQKSDFFLELKEDNKQEATKAEAAKVVEEKQPEVAQVAVDREESAGAQPEKKSKKTSVKAKSKAAKVESTPEVVTASTPVVITGGNGKAEPKEVAFATKYLITPSMSRRRPGPSLNAFKNMARQAKKPIV